MNGSLHDTKEAVLAVSHKVHVVTSNLSHDGIVGVLWGKAHHLVSG